MRIFENQRILNIGKELLSFFFSFCEVLYFLFYWFFLSLTFLFFTSLKITFWFGIPFFDVFVHSCPHPSLCLLLVLRTGLPLVCTNPRVNRAPALIDPLRACLARFRDVCVLNALVAHAQRAITHVPVDHLEKICCAFQSHVRTDDEQLVTQ